MNKNKHHVMFCVFSAGFFILNLGFFFTLLFLVLLMIMLSHDVKTEKQHFVLGFSFDLYSSVLYLRS